MGRRTVSQIASTALLVMAFSTQVLGLCGACLTRVSPDPCCPSEHADSTPALTAACCTAGGPGELAPAQSVATVKAPAVGLVEFFRLLVPPREAIGRLSVIPVTAHGHAPVRPLALLI